MESRSLCFATLTMVRLQNETQGRSGQQANVSDSQRQEIAQKLIWRNKTVFEV